MESTSTLQILIVSGACCSPNLTHQDQMLEKALAEALKDIGNGFEVRKVSLSHALHSKDGLTAKQHELILALFQMHNTRFTPALFLNDEVKFIGKIPSVEQLQDALKNIVSSVQGE